MVLQIIKSFFRAKSIDKKGQSVIEWNGVSVSKYRVWPHLIDYNIHMNNAKYMKKMEHARWAHITDMGWFYKLFKTKLNLVISSMEITFIRELSLMTPFEIHSKFLTWDEKYIYIEQKFMVKGKLYGHALVKFAGVQKGKRVYTKDIFKILELDYDLVKKCPEIEHWNAMSVAKRESAKRSA